MSILIHTFINTPVFTDTFHLYTIADARIFVPDIRGGTGVDNLHSQARGAGNMSLVADGLSFRLFAPAFLLYLNKWGIFRLCTHSCFIETSLPVEFSQFIRGKYFVTGSIFSDNWNLIGKIYTPAIYQPKSKPSNNLKCSTVMFLIGIKSR